MDGHDQAVLHGHPRHLVHHVGFEVVAVLRGGPARAGAVKEFRRVAGVELECRGRPDAVVGRDRAVVHEVAAPVFQGGEVAGVAGGAVARCRDEPVHIRGPGGVCDVQVGVGPESGQDASVERGVLGDRRVAGQGVQGVVRGGEDLDVEVLEQLPRPEARLLQPGGDRVVAGIGGVGADLLVEAEDALELGAEPVPGGGSFEQGPGPAELAPDGAGVRFRGVRCPQPVQRNAAGVDQPGDVVVRADQQRCRVREGGVVLDDGGVNVPVRGDDGEVLDPAQQFARNAARSGIRGQEPVGVGGNRL